MTFNECIMQTAHRTCHRIFANFGNSGVDLGGRLERSPPLKPTKVTLFTMILYKS